jgi:putative addiction module component (TIGR02574 family)
MWALTAALPNMDNWGVVCVSLSSNLYPKIAMATVASSLFDLSPSEKLQLVEDLWDDLAATPAAVPIHDWQKEELARRKTNLMNNPASGLSWDDIKRRVRSRYGR